MAIVLGQNLVNTSTAAAQGAVRKVLQETSATHVRLCVFSLFCLPLMISERLYHVWKFSQEEELNFLIKIYLNKTM